MRHHVVKDNATRRSDCLGPFAPLSSLGTLEIAGIVNPDEANWVADGRSGILSFLDRIVNVAAVAPFGDPLYLLGRGRDPAGAA
jgi:hypothetical protein